MKTEESVGKGERDNGKGEGERLKMAKVERG